MRLHFCMSICFKFFNHGWYVVTKCIILPLACLVCFLSADCHPAKETSDNVLSIRLFRVTTCFKLCFEVTHDLLEIFFRGVCSKKSDCFFFNKASLNAWWVARGIVCLLKGLSHLVVSFDVEDSFFN